MKKILLIDDDHDIHAQTKFVLEKNGFCPISAFDGREGLEKIINDEPDLVILDYMMPGQNGIDVYNTLKTSKKFSNCNDVPVIMLTAYSQPVKEVKKLMEDGLHVYLEKPFGNKELINVINNTLLLDEINKRKLRLDQALQNCNNFLENLVENCPAVIISCDKEGCITFVNRWVESILGYTSEQLINKPLDAVLNHNNNLIGGLFENLSENTPFYSLELAALTNLGESIPMGFTFSFLKDETAVVGLLGVGQDLSDRKRLEKESLEKARLEAITESMATINHQINNPLTPLIGNIQLIRRDKEKLSKDHVKKLDIIESNAKRISEIVKQFNEISKPLRRKHYYDDATILEI